MWPSCPEYARVEMERGVLCVKILEANTQPFGECSPLLPIDNMACFGP